MGILDFFKRPEQPQTNQPSDQKRDDTSTERRLHDRYHLDHERFHVASIHLESGDVGTVTDISYGGILASFCTDIMKGNMPEGRIRPVVCLFDRSCKMAAQPIRTTTEEGAVTYGGFRLVHDSPETLLFLRDFIEPLRAGESLRAISKEVAHERFQGDQWHCFRGDGPTNLVLRLEENQPNECHLIFREGKRYSELIYRDNRLTTGQTKEDDEADHDNSMGLTSLIQSTRDPEPTIIRTGLTILLGARQTLPPDLHKPIDTLMEALFSTGSEILREKGEGVA